MVDALRRAWSVLRPRGHVVDVQPADAYTPSLALVAGGLRRAIGALRRTPDEGVAAAHRARRSVVSAGLFTRVVTTHGIWRSRYDGPSDIRWLLRQNPNWDIDAAVERRLAAAWARRPQRAALEIRRTYSLAVLRKRACA